MCPQTADQTDTDTNLETRHQSKNVMTTIAEIENNVDIRSSLSDASLAQQAASAAAEVVSSQAVEGRCRRLRPRPHCCPLTLN